jgi:3-hydroxyisobutyrate dehydrogenase-like beta-hydroxyacid dehydrogenase
MENGIGIGFVGLGNMGNRMAGCIHQSGYDLTIHDILPSFMPGALRDTHPGSAPGFRK